MGALELIRLWVAIKPLKRWKEHRAAKRAAENQVTENVPVETPPEDSGMFSELAKSWARSALKILGTAVAAAVVTHGWIDPASTDAFTVALEAIGGGVVTIGGLVLSHRKHA